MDKHRDELCQRIAERVYSLMDDYGTHKTKAEKVQEIGEWLESSDYATEELATITPGELAQEWEWRISGKRGAGLI